MTEEIQDNHPKPKNTLDRRGFLELAWKSLLGLSGALGLGGLLRYFWHQPYPAPPTRFDLGPASEFNLSTATVVEEAQAVLMPAGGELRALSLVCPHLGCSVEMNEDGFECPCHGSRFGPDGELEKGPANRALRTVKVEIDEKGHLILDTG